MNEFPFIYLYFWYLNWLILSLYATNHLKQDGAFAAVYSCIATFLFALLIERSISSYLSSLLIVLPVLLILVLFFGQVQQRLKTQHRFALALVGIVAAERSLVALQKTGGTLGLSTRESPFLLQLCFCLP